MMFPIIKVLDKATGHEHIVGTDTHDKLVISDGCIHYYNLQNGEGTNGGDYEFVSDYSYDGLEEVGFGDMSKVEELNKKHEKEVEEFQKMRTKLHDFLWGEEGIWRVIHLI